MGLERDHRDWILESYRKTLKKNPRYSLRSFSKKLSISPSTLSEILAGKRCVTKKMAEKLSTRLQLNPAQAKLFTRSAVLARMQKDLPADVEINAASDKLSTRIDLEKFKVISEWYYSGILCVLETGNTSSEAIAERLGLSASTTRGALTRLEKLGFIRRNNAGSWEPSQNSLCIETKGYETAIRRFLLQGMRKAADSLQKDPAEEREICAAAIAIDPNRLDEARALIKRFRIELTELLESGNKQRAYMLGIQLFPVDKKMDKELENENACIKT